MVIVGAGIGGLAAALACARAEIPGCETAQLLEQRPVLGEVGAGIQLGPNVVRILEGWGLGPALRSVAAYPEALQVRHAIGAHLLGALPLGAQMVQRYGAAYATIARADMHGLLVDAVRQHSGLQLLLGRNITSFEQDPEGVHVQVRSETDSESIYTGVLIGADGLWSSVRTQLLNDGMPQATGHLAYRAMVPQASLPEGMRTQMVTAWLGPKFHVVQYPVRGGEWLNLVAIVHGQAPGDLREWDHSANAPELQALLANACGPLLDVVHAIDDWRLWALCDRPAMRSAAEHAHGRVALLGDAAHPMRPYLAQGAGMAIEDAAALAQALAEGNDIPVALRRYAQSRWQRNARVQARAARNGHIFHMQGAMALARDTSLRVLGAKLLDVPWLYGFGAPGGTT